MFIAPLTSSVLTGKEFWKFEFTKPCQQIKPIITGFVKTGYLPMLSRK